MDNLEKIGFGGGCHWCTEAVFQHLRGVKKVEQGWIASSGENNTLSEAVIVEFDASIISIEILIEVHLRTHKSTSKHSMRKKYRSAIYTFSEKQNKTIKVILNNLQSKFEEKIITKIIPFVEFKASREQIQNYYKKNPEKPFCETFINPKLSLLLKEFTDFTRSEDLQHLKLNVTEKS